VAAVVALGSIAAASAAVLTRGGGSSSSAVAHSPGGKARIASSASRALPTKGIGVIRLGDRFSQASGYGRYSYVIVGRGDANKAARYHGTSLVYMAGMDIAEFNTGVSTSEASAHHWLLRDADGNLLVEDGYDNVHLADVGSSAYQRAWLRNVLGFLRSTGIRGVFIDDVQADASLWTVGHVYPAAYPDQPSWAAAMTSFVRAVGPALKARGYYVLLNANGHVPDSSSEDSGQYDASWWRQLAPYASGLLKESWQQNPIDAAQMRSLGVEWYQLWGGWERLVSVAQRAGVDFFGLTYGTRDDVRAMRFGKASFMLDWNGRGGAFMFETTEGDPYNLAWGADLGRPLRRKVKLEPGVWRRRYERGLVVVNATLEPVTVHVHGAPVTIQQTDALFLSA
jgi:hypothetical protein